MGYLKDGEWHEGQPGFADEDGEFRRQQSQFRDWVTPDGGKGPDGQRGIEAAPDRFHLYVSYACPWAHRTLIMRRLKGLEDMIPVSVTHWVMKERGWTFDEGEGVVPDPYYGAPTIHHLYQRADDGVNGKATVPVLWDRYNDTIVNNESSEIIRMMNTGFSALGANDGDYYPAELRAEIDEVNERVYEDVNNGVYKAGFAETQEAYEGHYDKLFAALDWLEGRLGGKEYLVGDRLTEADIRLYTTLLRFDAVYHNHFRCNRNKIAEMPNLQAYLERLSAIPAFAETIHMGHAKRHYYMSHEKLNPTGIVPKGPAGVQESA